MDTRRSPYKIKLNQFYWYDSLCKMYFNHKTKEWQVGLNNRCMYDSKQQAEEDKFYFYESEDIVLRHHYPFALAA